MGRRKIPIKKIENDRLRQITFHKRKLGVLKKAMELSILCGCDICLVIFNSQNRLYQYSSGDINKIMMKYTEHKGQNESWNNDDYEHFCKKKTNTTSRSFEQEKGVQQKDRGEDQFISSGENLEGDDSSKGVVPAKDSSMGLPPLRQPIRGYPSNSPMMVPYGDRVPRVTFAHNHQVDENEKGLSISIPESVQGEDGKQLSMTGDSSNYLFTPGSLPSPFRSISNAELQTQANIGFGGWPTTPKKTAEQTLSESMRGNTEAKE